MSRRRLTQFTGLHHLARIPIGLACGICGVWARSCQFVPGGPPVSTPRRPAPPDPLPRCQPGRGGEPDLLQPGSMLSGCHPMKSAATVQKPAEAEARVFPVTSLIFKMSPAMGSRIILPTGLAGVPTAAPHPFGIMTFWCRTGWLFRLAEFGCRSTPLRHGWEQAGGGIGGA